MKAHYLLILFFASIFVLNSCDKKAIENINDNIEYPEQGDYGVNLLTKEKVDYSAGTASMCAILGLEDKIKVKLIGDPWWFHPTETINFWEHSDWNNSEKSREFTSTAIDTIDAEIELVKGTAMQIVLYENEEAIWAKSFTVQ